MYTYDAIGSYERTGYSCQGSGKDLMQPVLDNQLKAASPLLVPARVSNSRTSRITQQLLFPPAAGHSRSSGPLVLEATAMCCWLSVWHQALARQGLEGVCAWCLSTALLAADCALSCMPCM